MMKIPNRASKIAEKYIIEKDATLKVYAWHSSKGYHTDFQPVAHLGVTVTRNSDNKILVRRVTASHKTAKEWIAHFNKSFNLGITASSIIF